MSDAKLEFEFRSKEISTEPGCYLYFDERDELLYVGKAKNLRKRVSSYFQKKHDHPRLIVMVGKIRRIETRVVSSELEALLLEKNLIQTLHPRFNVRLRDDKNWVYLRITNEETPKMEIVRRQLKDKATYIGPKTSTKEFRKTVRFCQKYFQIQMVKESQNYYPHMAQGKQLSADDYQANVERMKKFLRGHTREILAELTERMMDFAKNQNFEAAAKLRDTIQSIEVSSLRQTVEFTDQIDRDFIEFIREGNKAYVVRLVFREGKLRDQTPIKMSWEDFEDEATFVEHFLLQFYDKVTDPPREIMVPVELPNTELLIDALSELLPGNLRVTIHAPKIGDKKKVLEIAKKNAEQFCQRTKVEEMAHEEMFAKALPELAEALGFAKPPQRIECYDVSHHQGDGTVASQVVFVDGEPRNSEYRKYTIKSLETGKIDDYASMKEVLRRRFAKMVVKEEKPSTDGNLQMKLVETDEEWKEYHKIAEKEVFNRHHPEIVYNNNHPDLKLPETSAYLLVQNETVYGACLLKKLSKSRLQLALLGIKSDFQKQGMGTKFLGFIEDYARENEYKSIVLNAHPSAVNFYKKSDYSDNFWKGNSSLPGMSPMGKKLKVEKDPGSMSGNLPDLIVLDGGKGQLSTVMKIFAESVADGGLAGVDMGGFDPQTQIISLAKREEQIFRPGNPEPLELSYDSAALKLLQRARDEAHRFAINFGRQTRAKKAQKSILDDVPGIGPKTKKDLMKKFESVGGIREATDEQLLEVLKPKQLENLRKFI